RQFDSSATMADSVMAYAQSRALAENKAKEALTLAEGRVLTLENELARERERAAQNRQGYEASKREWSSKEQNANARNEALRQRVSVLEDTLKDLKEHQLQDLREQLQATQDALAQRTEQTRSLAEYTVSLSKKLADASDTRAVDKKLEQLRERYRALEAHYLKLIREREVLLGPVRRLGNLAPEHMRVRAANMLRRLRED
ncbi:MAG: hypothetical protein AAF658_06715, partial [Myxococcota bacterium]